MNQLVTVDLKTLPPICVLCSNLRKIGGIPQAQSTMITNKQSWSCAYTNKLLKMVITNNYVIIEYQDVNKRRKVIISNDQEAYDQIINEIVKYFQ
jgi:hypothetical protein